LEVDDKRCRAASRAGCSEPASRRSATKSDDTGGLSLMALQLILIEMHATLPSCNVNKIVLRNP
jgi:hypothetical protein